MIPAKKVRLSIALLVTNGLDGIQFGGLDCRINSKQQSDKYRNSERDAYGRPCYHRRPAGSRRDDLRQREPEPDTDQSAGDRNYDGFRKELTHNIGLPCTDSAANTDFPGALQNRGQHDVHDADAAHQERNAGDAEKNAKSMR